VGECLWDLAAFVTGGDSARFVLLDLLSSKTSHRFQVAMVARPILLEEVMPTRVTRSMSISNLLGSKGEDTIPQQPDAKSPRMQPTTAGSKDIASLQVQIRQLLETVEEKDRIIAEKDKEIETLSGKLEALSQGEGWKL